MPHCQRRRRLLALAIAAAGFGSAALAAQLQSNKGDIAPQETIEIQAGDILEILPVHSLPSATYSWILTQDRNFIEVARSAFYNTRLTTPGRFTLNAEVSAQTGQAVLRRVFTIDVLPRRPPSADTVTPSTEPVPSTAPLVRTTPEPDNEGRVILPPRRELILLTPLHSDLRPLHLDLDARNDADDDGTLTNDSDNAGTFFQTSGTPLHLWFTNATEQRDITLSATAPDGAPLTQTLSVLPAAYAMQRGLFVSRVLIATEERGPKSLLFSPQFEDGGAPAIPLAFHWDFGDDSESIEERPLHEFAVYGTYSVRLSVRNIETGQELAARTKAIALQAPLIRDPRDDGPPPALPPEPPAPPPRASFLRIVFTIIGVAVGFAAIGFAVAWGYRAAQAHLLPPPVTPPSPPKTPQPPAPAPVPAPPKPAQPPKAAPPTPSVPVPEAKKQIPSPAAPDWLKKTAPSEVPPAPPAPPSPKPPPPSPQPPTAPPFTPPLPKPPQTSKPQQQSPAPAAIRVAPHPSPLPIGEGKNAPAPPAQSAATPPKPVPPAPPAPPKKPVPSPPAVPTISTVPSVPPPESDRTIAIVQAENLPPPPKPPAPPSPQTKS